MSYRKDDLIKNLENELPGKLIHLMKKMTNENPDERGLFSEHMKIIQEISILIIYIF